MIRTVVSAAFALGVALLAPQDPAAAQTKWNLPAAYPPDNPHTENLVRLRQGRRATATGGKLQITVHAGASLFKAPEIKRAVQTGQAQVGRGADLDPRERGPGVRPRRGAVPRNELRRQSTKLWEASKRGDGEEARRAGHDGAVRRAVGAAGHLRQEGHQLGRRHEGPEVARLQCRHHAHRRTGRRAAGDDPGGRAAAGAGDRRRQLLHDLGLDRLRQQGLGDA